MKAIAKELPRHNAAIKENPGSAAAHFHRGRVFQHYGEPLEHAIDDFTGAIELAPMDPDAPPRTIPRSLVFRGCCLCYRSLGRSTSSKPQRGDYKKAIADFTKAIELDPDCRMAYFERADCYEYQGEKEKARKGFEKLLHISESMPKKATDPQKVSQLKADIAMVRERLEKL